MNAQNYYERERKRVTTELAEVERASRELFKYDAQIIRAKAMGLNAFDKEKFGKKRRDDIEERK